MSQKISDITDRRSLWVILMWLSWIGMWALYLPLYRHFGALAGLLGVVPVGLSGGIAGRRIGLLAAMVAMGNQTTLLYLAGYPSEIVHQPSLYLAGMALFSWVGLSLGQMHALGGRLRRELEESEQTKAALEQIEARHRALLYALPDCLFHVSEDARVRDALSWRDVFDPQGAAERPWPVGIDEKMQEKIDLVLTSRVAQQMEYNVKQRQAGEHAYEARIVAVHPEEALVIVRDITAHKNLERKLQQAHEEAVQAAEERSAFLARMSHEIRTPLHGMLTALELLQNEHRQLDDSELLQIVRESGLMLQDLVNDILDFSKLQAGRLELEQISFHLPDLIESVLSFFWPQAHNKSLPLVGMIDPDLPRHIWGDPLRLRQILMNLIANALKFTHAGQVSVNAERLGESVRLSVRDTGIGIEAEAIPRLFSIFEQAHASTSRHFGGTGLGLVIAKQLAERMGGRIEVSSTPNVGSCFAVWLPLTTQKQTCGLVWNGLQPSVLPLVGIESWVPPPRILWVDRLGARRVWAMRLLSAWGCTCESVASLDEAEARLLWSEHEPTGVSLCWIEADGLEEQAWSWLASYAESPVASRCAYVVSLSNPHFVPRWAAARTGLFVFERRVRQEEMRRVLSLALAWQKEQRHVTANPYKKAGTTQSSTSIRLERSDLFPSYHPQDRWGEAHPPMTAISQIPPSSQLSPHPSAVLAGQEQAPYAEKFAYPSAFGIGYAMDGLAYSIGHTNDKPAYHTNQLVDEASHKIAPPAGSPLSRAHPRNEPPRKGESRRSVHDLSPLSVNSESSNALEAGLIQTMFSTEQQKHSITTESFSPRGGGERTEHPTKRFDGDPARGRGLQTKELRVGEKEARMEKAPQTRPPKNNKAGISFLQQDQGEALSASEKSERPRVLVVEDNLLNQRVMTLTLERLGYAVDLASNGQEALFSLQRSCDVPYKVILMDCQMPELDGYQTTALIRQRFAKGLPIIGMSASDLEEDKQRALDAGMDDYLAKPVRQETLARALSTWCRPKHPQTSVLGG